MQNTYDPLTGEFTKSQGFNTVQNHKTIIDVTQLDGRGSVVSNTRLIGAYIKSWKLAEFNYTTNEFHTIECVFRPDFVQQSNAIPK